MSRAALSGPSYDDTTAASAFRTVMLTSANVFVAWNCSFLVSLYYGIWPNDALEYVGAPELSEDQQADMLRVLRLRVAPPTPSWRPWCLPETRLVVKLGKSGALQDVNNGPMLITHDDR